MIVALISVVFIIAMICAGNNGEWGSVAVGAVIVVAVLLLGSAGRSTSRAYNNIVDYWSRGGPDKKR